MAPNVKTLAGLLPAALLLLVAVWEIAATARAGEDVPGPGDWAAASDFVRERHSPGELLVFAPDWLDPVGRLHLGDLIPIEMAARMDGARYRAVWELSARGARAPETAGLSPESEAHFGALSVRRYVREPADVVTDFVDAFERRRARVEGDVAGRPGVSLEEVGFEPHRCVKVIPRPNKTVTVTYQRARLGTELVGYVGLADVFERRDIRNPARLEVSVEGKKVASVTVGVESGWVRFEAETAPSERAEVSFAATAIGKNARRRLVCFAAEARR